MIPHGASAVMASRVEPPDALDYFPTPPWATRALFEHVFPALDLALPHDVWEPAAGEGHMAEVIREYAIDVRASDIYDYGKDYERADFLDEFLHTQPVEWIITNPPFKVALEFVQRALGASKGVVMASKGIAMFTRMQWLEGQDRYAHLFKPTPPTLIALFTERVPLVKGRCDFNASSATAYVWNVWSLETALPSLGRSHFFWIPPCRLALTKPDDERRYGKQSSGPLL